MIDTEEHDFTEELLREKYGYIQKPQTSMRDKLKKKLQCNALCIKKFILNFVPILTWLPKYPFRNYALGDALGGLTVAVIRIPQGLAYGLLAGLYPINGLYTGFFSPLVYLIFGTSRHLSVGVFSIVSLMLGAALQRVEIDTEKHFKTPVSTEMVISHSTTISPATKELVTNADFLTSTPALSSFTTQSGNIADSEGHFEYTDEQDLAIIGALTVLIGLVLIVMGIFRLGFVALLLSEPLVSGFTTGAALYVVTAQMKYVTGIPLSRRSGAFSIIKTYIEILSRIKEIQWAAVIMSAICLIILVPIKYVNRTYRKQLRNIPIPVELFIVVLGTTVSYVANLHEKYELQIIGYVPSGMPSPTLPMISLWPKLIGDAISISVVIFAVSASLGKMFAKKHGYKIDANQELFALGLCQVTNGIFQGHAGGGALARSIVQESSGGHTELVGLVSSSILLLVLLVIGPLFESLPVACLACIILANLHGLLMQFGRLSELWKLDKYDFFVWLLTFTAVFLLGVDLGLGLGVVLSLFINALRTYSTNIRELGLLPDTSIYRDINKFRDADVFPSIKIIQFPESPSYVNKTALQSISSDILVKKSSSKKSKKQQEFKITDDTDDGITDESILSSGVKFVILDCSMWSSMDTVGLSTLKQVVSDLNTNEIQVYLASVSDEICHKLHFVGLLGEASPSVEIYPDIRCAVKAAERHQNSQENRNHESNV